MPAKFYAFDHRRFLLGSPYLFSYPTQVSATCTRQRHDSGRVQLYAVMCTECLNANAYLRWGGRPTVRSAVGHYKNVLVDLSALAGNYRQQWVAI